MSLVLILRVFCVRRVYRGSLLFSLVLILHIPAYLGIKGDQFFMDFFWRSFYVQIDVHCSPCPILREIECIEFVCHEFVLVLVQINLIQFEFSNCIRSICTKTNTISLHTNSIHSILHKNRTISRKIRQVIQIVVHQFEHKTSTKKNLVCKKSIPLYPQVRGNT